MNVIRFGLAGDEIRKARESEERYQARLKAASAEAKARDKAEVEVYRPGALGPKHVGRMTREQLQKARENGLPYTELP